MTDTALGGADRLARWLACVGVALVVLAAGALSWAIATPLDSGEEEMLAASAARPGLASPAPRDVDVLLRKIAGRRIIRAAQDVPTVMDPGLAGRLLKKLALEGVVSVGGKTRAYVRVEGGSGARCVTEGQKLLEFVVEKINPDEVVLSLDGVIVKLGR